MTDPTVATEPTGEVTEPTVTTEPTVETQPTGEVAEPTVETQPTKPEPTDAPPPEPTTDSDTSQNDRVVPEADGYKLPDGIPQELGKFAHENGFTQEQLDATLKTFGQYIQGQETFQKNALRQAGEAHVKNWGDESKYKLSLAKRALKQNDPNGELAKALDATGYGNHPAVLDFLYTIGQNMQEGGFLKSAVHRPPGEKSLAQAMYPNHPSNE